MSNKQKLRLVQLALFAETQYAGSTDGEVVEFDVMQIKENVLEEIASLGNFAINLLILACLAAGYDDELNDDGIAGRRLIAAVCKAFGIPIAEKVEVVAQ